MGDILARLRAFARAAAARRRALRELEALPDRMLADAGLDRADLTAYVDANWPWPRPPFAPRARLRPSRRGCG